MTLLTTSSACVLACRLTIFRVIGDHEIKWELPRSLNHHAIDGERQRKGFAVLVPVATHRWVNKNLLQQLAHDAIAVSGLRIKAAPCGIPLLFLNGQEFEPVF